MAGLLPLGPTAETAELAKLPLTKGQKLALAGVAAGVSFVVLESRLVRVAIAGGVGVTALVLLREEKKK